MNSQLALPLAQYAKFERDDFVVGPVNADAMAFIDTWPEWPVGAAALIGPNGCGKSHLLAIWRERSGAHPIDVLDRSVPQNIPLAIEDVDRMSGKPECAQVLFEVMERASRAAPVLFTARLAPQEWPCGLPDLGSRFAALPSFALRPPDEALLADIVRKLFAKRQLSVPESVIAQMLQRLERTPGAVRQFVDMLDKRALAQSRAVTPAFVREQLAAG